MARGVVQQQIRVVIEPANDARTGGDVRQQQAPRGGGPEPRRKDHGRVGVKRAGRSGIAREFTDAQCHQ